MIPSTKIDYARIIGPAGTALGRDSARPRVVEEQRCLSAIAFWCCSAGRELQGCNVPGIFSLPITFDNPRLSRSNKMQLDLSSLRVRVAPKLVLCAGYLMHDVVQREG
jgi:hypothetical protein